MRSVKVFFKDKEAGVLTQLDDASFKFIYNPQWVEDVAKPPISPTLPKTLQPYQSQNLFPFFFNILPEGANKKLICRNYRIDEDDYMGIIMVMAKTDTIGAIHIEKSEPS